MRLDEDLMSADAARVKLIANFVRRDIGCKLLSIFNYRPVILLSGLYLIKY